MEYEVVVIGAGIGGLTAAAVLAKRGVNVCLLERQPYAGGCAANVAHAGYQFEPTHGLYCGWEPNGVFDQLFGELNVPAPQVRRLATPYLVRLPEGQDVPRINGLEEIDLSLKAAFPECADAAIQFYRDLRSAGASGTNLGSTSARFRGFIDIQLRALAQCSSVGCDDRLLASALDPRRSFWEIQGGAQSLVNALENSFKHSGGKMRLSAPVLRLAFGFDGSPVGVDLLNGERVFASRAIISNLTIWDTYGKLIGPTRTPRPLSSALKAMSAFGSYQIFLTINEPAAAALPADRILLLTEVHDEEPFEPAENQLNFYLASRGEDKTKDYSAVVSAYTNAQDWFSFHEDLAAFEERDQSMLEKIWARLHSAMPELGDGAEVIETATPHTFYEITRRRFGMIGRPAPASPSGAAAPFPNLLLVGDTVADSFGVDSTVEFAWRTAQQLIG
jgi:phytoene dehydrogenase-like protein